MSWANTQLFVACTTETRTRSKQRDTNKQIMVCANVCASNHNAGFLFRSTNKQQQQASKQINIDLIFANNWKSILQNKFIFSQQS